MMGSRARIVLPGRVAYQVVFRRMFDDGEIDVHQYGESMRRLRGS